MPYYIDTSGNTLVLEFGQGDLMIGSARPAKDGPPDELVIWPRMGGPSLIGEANADDAGKSTAAVSALVRLVFPDPRSLDVLIGQALELRAEMGDGPPLQGDDRVAATLRIAMDELRKEKPGDRSERDRLYAIAITDLQKLVAFFEMTVRHGDDGGTAALDGDGEREQIP